MDEQKKRRFLSLWLVIGVLGIAAVAYTVMAFSGSTVNNVENCNDCTLTGSQTPNVGQADTGDELFGAAYPGGNNPNRVPHGYVDTADGYAVDGVKMTDGSGFWIGNAGKTTYGEVIIDITATTSATTLNPIGDTIYVSLVDSYLYITDATTTAGVSTDVGIQYLMGTSTATVAKDATCLRTGTCTSSPSGHASILQTGRLTTTVVNNNYFALDYPGTDQRDGSGVQYWVPIQSTDYLSCFASSTPAFVGSSSQGVKCVFKYASIDY